MLTNLLSTGAISEHVYEEVVTEIDAALVVEAEPDDAEPDPNAGTGGGGADGRRHGGMTSSGHLLRSACLQE